jgi:flagellar motor switch protein FliM
VIVTFTAESVAGPGIVQLPLLGAMTCIDGMLGGRATGEQPDRPLTDVESVLVRDIVDRILGELQTAMSVALPIAFTIGSVEQNTQFARAHSGHDSVVVAQFAVKVGEVECPITLVMATAGLMSALEKANVAGPMSESDRRAKALAGAELKASLQSVPIDVAVRFGSRRIRPADVLDLGVGDVLSLRHPTSAPLSLVVDDLPVVAVVPGAQGSRLACLVVESAADPASTIDSAREATV